jgi:hypothetical protein
MKKHAILRPMKNLQIKLTEGEFEELQLRAKRAGYGKHMDFVRAAVKHWDGVVAPVAAVAPLGREEVKEMVNDLLAKGELRKGFNEMLQAERKLFGEMRKALEDLKAAEEGGLDTPETQAASQALRAADGKLVIKEFSRFVNACIAERERDIERRKKEEAEKPAE